MIFSTDWLLILSLFFVWFLAECLKSFIDGKLERRMERIRIQERAERMEINREARRLVRERELERESERMIAEYRSRELESMYARERERFDPLVMDGKYYVRGTENHGVVEYRAFSEWHEAYSSWRSQQDSEADEPLAFDNSDDGRVYVNGVAVDNDDSSEDVYSDSEDEWEFTESDFESWMEEKGLSGRDRYVESRRMSYDAGDYDGYGDGDFESADDHRRGEFRGGY